MASTGEASKRRPALDGLRGVAILLVVVGHSVAWMPNGGEAGVSLFFVLSGYLITGLLLSEVRRTGRIDLGAFYRRRAVRLFPALAVVMAATLALSLAIGHRFVTPQQVAATGLYGSNWLLASGGHVGVLLHTWSLAIEEQFYLAFPLAVVLLARRPRVLLWGCVTVAVASAAWRVVLLTDGGPYERFYYGTDTNMAPILLGCVLAVVAAHRPVRVTPRWALGALVAVGLLGFAPEGAGARCLVPVAAGILGVVAVAGLRDVDSAPGWLQLVGRRSYGLYLWHGVVLWMFCPNVPNGRPVAVTAVAVASWLLAVASWRYVEEPFLRFRSANIRRPAAQRSLSGAVAYRAGDAADAAPAAAL